MGVVGVVHFGHVGLGDVGVVYDRLGVVFPDDATAAALHLQREGVGIVHQVFRAVTPQQGNAQSSSDHGAWL